MSIPNDIMTSLLRPTTHKDDRPDYVQSLEMEVSRLRAGLLNDALRGRLAYELRVRCRDLNMTEARRIVDTALAEALKGGTP